MVLIVVEDAFYSQYVSKTFLRSYSYTANPITCETALASIKIFKNKSIDIISKIKNINTIHNQKVKKLLDKYNFIEKIMVYYLIPALGIK